MSERIQCPDCARRFGGSHALRQHRAATHDNPNWTPGAVRPTKQAPICPKCGDAAALTPGRFGTKAECCGLWSWNLKPLVARETHAARIRAHDVFDRLWKDGALPRGESYHRLALAMGMTLDECHIGLMTETQALRVVEIVRSGTLLELVDV